MILAMMCFLADSLLCPAYPADRAPVLAWVEVVGTEGRFPLLADGARGGDERQAMLDAARRRDIPLRLPRIADAYQLGHVATETDGALAPLRRMAAGGVLLIGTLTRRADGYWDASWQTQDLRNGAEGTEIAGDLHRERIALDGAIVAGIELAARVRANRQ